MSQYGQNNQNGYQNTPQNNQNGYQNTPQNNQNSQNPNGGEQKPLPSVELSLKFMSWSVKELVTAMTVQQKILDQKLSEITNQLREINKNISTKETPF